MCGRYFLDAPADAIARQFDCEVAQPPAASYNIAPTQQVGAVRCHEDARELSLLRWGLIPFWTKEDPGSTAKMINARAETVASKPAYRQAFKRRRCIVPASGFYEWQRTAGGKQPYAIRPAGEELFGFAGIWERWQPSEGEPIESCAIITTDANRQMAPIHDRMPVILQPDDYAPYLGGDPDEAQACLRSYPDELMLAYPIGKAVNNPKNDRADLLDEAAP